MQSTDDSALLRQYSENHSDDAFAALVTRHINLVYSVALRHVGDPHQAEEVTQAVFILLAKKAAQLRHDKALSSWLFQATRLTVSNLVRSETRRHHREQEAHMQSVLDESGSDIWRQIAPLLDTAVASLSEKDRHAIVLRFYEGRNLREVGAALGASEDAAEKRVSRAVERLREFFAKRGVTVGASGLVVVISANAVQAAPVGLVVTISAAVALAGTTIATTATATATKAIAVTTLQKAVITATLAAAVGTGIYQARHASRLRDQVQKLQQQQAPLAVQIQQLTREKEEATTKLAALRDENDRLSRNTGELLKLRGEVARLRKDTNELAASKPAQSVLSVSDPNWKPNWVALRPFDLAQFADSTTNILRDSAVDVGTATPAALLQTWIWAQRTGDTVGILKTWDFPEDTTEEAKFAQVKELQNHIEFARNNPDRIGYSEQSKLRDLFLLGENRYLAFIEQTGLTTGKSVSHQMFRQVGDEWRVCVGTGAK